jgi:sulfoxide reductase catalytic subunit YedY
VFRDRRRLIQAAAAGPLILAAGPLARVAWGAGETGDDPTAHLYPAPRNTRYALERPLTDEMWVTTYNNFYEFGSHKEISKAAQALPIRPWTVSIDGLVEKPVTIGIDELIAKMPLEERLYRHRCVEAWSMAVPWSGFPLKALVDFARPLGSAKYLEMQTFMDKHVAPGQKQFWYPWPYVEGLTIEEATNELAFIATGLYGKPIPRQNGAPLRLAVPWKYGFKSIKSIVRFTFTNERPKTFWEIIQPSEYGFWANVNPKVPHPRWSQARERVLGTTEKVPTRLFNGYGEFVAHLYTGLDGERLYV